jgi:GNAT superfamily N-acetyltransferase
MIANYAKQQTPGAQLNAVAAALAKPEIVFSAWWRSDPATEMAPLIGFEAQLASDYQLVAQLARLDLGEVLARVDGGHRPYIARLGGAPVAYGWAANRSASIGELGLDFAIPAGNCYLWDFATLPAWRGLGIYPRLLQAILAREAAQADRFWIGHVRENSASGRGILRAGFRVAGATYYSDGRAMTFAAAVASEQAAACAALLGLGLSHAPSVRSA